MPNCLLTHVQLPNMVLITSSVIISGAIPRSYNCILKIEKNRPGSTMTMDDVKTARAR